MNAERIFLRNEAEQRMDVMDDDEKSMYRSLVKIKYRAQSNKVYIMQRARVYAGFIVGLVLSVPFCGVCYSALYGWFLSWVGLGAMNWFSAYCTVFVIRVILLGVIAQGPSYFNEIHKAAHNKESLFDTWQMSDPAYAMLYTFFNEVKIPAAGLCAGFILKTILNM